VASVVILSGFMGSGKTSVGLAAAQRLGWAFVDLDAEIERQERISIPDIFSARGETYFRKVESDTLQAVVRAGHLSPGMVLALGGGTLTNPAAVQLAKSVGYLVYLQVDIGVAWERVAASSRPLAGDKHDFAELFEQRVMIYENTADLILPVCEKTVEELAEDVAAFALGLKEADA